MPNELNYNLFKYASTKYNLVKTMFVYLACLKRNCNLYTRLAQFTGQQKKTLQVANG